MSKRVALVISDRPTALVYTYDTYEQAEEALREMFIRKAKEDDNPFDEEEYYGPAPRPTNLPLATASRYVGRAEPKRRLYHYRTCT